MAWGRRAQSQVQAEGPHPIGAVPDDVHEALDAVDARRLAQRIGELRRAFAPIPEDDERVRIIRCLPEATLFLSQIGRAMTAWRWEWPTGRVDVTYESGFRESPSEWTTPRDEGVVLATGDKLTT